MGGYVYMLASKKDGTLYTGLTADLGARVHDHKLRLGKGFTATHGAVRLVWYREYQLGHSVEHPSSGPSAHLLPQGEKERRELIALASSRKPQRGYPGSIP